jgi:hypothetical protein
MPRATTSRPLPSNYMAVHAIHARHMHGARCHQQVGAHDSSGSNVVVPSSIVNITLLLTCNCNHPDSCSLLLHHTTGSIVLLAASYPSWPRQPSRSTGSGQLPTYTTSQSAAIVLTHAKS